MTPTELQRYLENLGFDSKSLLGESRLAEAYRKRYPSNNYKVASWGFETKKNEQRDRITNRYRIC